jgi:hypothetical protein
MSAFTERTVQRALGASGRIQPRITPITAPSPWTMDAPERLELEVVEEAVGTDRVSARSELGSRDPAHAPGLFGGDVTRDLERPSLPERGATANRMAAAPEPVDRPSTTRSSSEALPTVPSFRARGLQTAVARALTPAMRGPDALESFGGVGSVELLGPAETLARKEVLELATVTASQGTEPRAPEAHGHGPSRGSRALAPVMNPVVLQPRTPRPKELDLPSAPAVEHTVEPNARHGMLEHEQAPWIPASVMPDVPPRRPGRRGGTTVDPVVRIDIGRVEVRAAPRPPAPNRAPDGIAKPVSFVSLQQYLNERGTS